MFARCIRNIELKVLLENGEVETRQFEYGALYDALEWRLIDEDYVSILFKDGTIVEGVSKKVFENHRLPVTIQEVPTETQEAVELESPEEDTTPIPLSGTMLGKDED